jgi:DNA-directed RNA polymerase specialized sigma24 family protein
MPLEEDTTGSHGLDKEYPFIVIEKGNFYLAKNKINIAVFDSNNPANIVIKDTENELLKKERLFYTKLSDFQKQVLEMRREGKTYKEIGNIFGCSDSRIKRHCADAKNIAAKIFGLKLDPRGS